MTLAVDYKNIKRWLRPIIIALQGPTLVIVSLLGWAFFRGLSFKKSSDGPKISCFFKRVLLPPTRRMRNKNQFKKITRCLLCKDFCHSFGVKFHEKTVSEKIRIQIHRLGSCHKCFSLDWLQIWPLCACVSLSKSKLNLQTLAFAEDGARKNVARMK